MKTLQFILLAGVLSLASCTSDDNNIRPVNTCLPGQGSIVSETRVLGNFHSVVNTVYADVLITQGPKEDVIIEAQPNILQELKTVVDNGQLRITTNRCVDINQAIKIHITIPDIRNLVLTGVGDIIAQNDFALTHLAVTLTGVGDFILRGTASTLDITLTGVGDVRTFQLNTDVCDVLISGVGDVEVFVNNELDVTITGTGSVFYKGHPIINSTITGSGGIVDAN